MPARRDVLLLLSAGLLRSVRAAAQSAAEILVAAMQDGGKIIYLRSLSAERLDRAKGLGRALRALRVPLNDIVASPAPGARSTAELAFGVDQLRGVVQPAKSLLQSPAGPGMNRVLVGNAAALEILSGRTFSDRELPEGAMAVFLPGWEPQLLGTITAERVITSAERRDASGR